MGSESAVSDYLADCWGLYWDVFGCHDEIRGHCPIAYFGNIRAYFDSSPRVLTVGLNPSHLEFPVDKSPRFPFSLDASNGVTSDREWLTSVYANDLNGYFDATRSPYRGWFDPSFKELLRGMKSSFYEADGKVGRAIHSDLFSPIATSPTWSGLSARNRALQDKLMREGVVLWRQLVEVAQPDVIIASMQRDNVQLLGLQFFESPARLTSVQERKGRTVATMQGFKLGNGRRGLLLTGGAGRKPMNGFSPEDRFKIGDEALARWQQMTG